MNRDAGGGGVDDDAGDSQAGCTVSGDCQGFACNGQVGVSVCLPNGSCGCDDPCQYGEGQTVSGQLNGDFPIMAGTRCLQGEAGGPVVVDTLLAGSLSSSSILGLDQIEYFSGGLTINNAQNVTDIEMDTVEVIDGPLTIIGNYGLTALNASSLRMVSGDLAIVRNPYMSQSDVQRIAPRLEAPPSLLVQQVVTTNGCSADVDCPLGDDGITWTCDLLNGYDALLPAVQVCHECIQDSMCDVPGGEVCDETPAAVETVIPLALFMCVPPGAG
jgi:hypothetical protein